MTPGNRRTPSGFGKVLTPAGPDTGTTSQQDNVPPGCREMRGGHAAGLCYAVVASSQREEAILVDKISLHKGGILS